MASNWAGEVVAAAMIPHQEYGKVQKLRKPMETSILILRRIDTGFKKLSVIFANTICLINTTNNHLHHLCMIRNLQTVVKPCMGVHRQFNYGIGLHIGTFQET